MGLSRGAVNLDGRFRRNLRRREALITVLATQTGEMQMMADMSGSETAGRLLTASRSRMRTSGSSSILPSRSTTSSGTGSKGTRRRRATCAPTNWRISASTRCRCSETYSCIGRITICIPFRCSLCCSASAVWLCRSLVNQLSLRKTSLLVKKTLFGNSRCTSSASFTS